MVPRAVLVTWPEPSLPWYSPMAGDPLSAPLVGGWIVSSPAVLLGWQRRADGWWGRVEVRMPTWFPPVHGWWVLMARTYPRTVPAGWLTPVDDDE